MTDVRREKSLLAAQLTVLDAQTHDRLMLLEDWTCILSVVPLVSLQYRPTEIQP